MQPPQWTLPSTFQGRLARQEDTEAIVQLLHQVQQEYQIPLEPKLSQKFANLAHEFQPPQGAFLLLFQASSYPVLVGTFALQAQSAKKLEFKWLYLLPTARRQGLGSALLRWGIAWAQHFSFATIELATDTAFREAIQLYESYGFQQHGKSLSCRCDRIYKLSLDENSSGESPSSR